MLKNNSRTLTDSKLSTMWLSTKVTWLIHAHFSKIKCNCFNFLGSAILSEYSFESDQLTFKIDSANWLGDRKLLRRFPASKHTPIIPPWWNMTCQFLSNMWGIIKWTTLHSCKPEGYFSVLPTTSNLNGAKSDCHMFL